MAIVKLNNQAVKNATSFGSISSLGSMTFIKKLTASSSATLSFVDGTDGVVLDDTYKEYCFTFNNMHPSNDGNNLRFQTSTDGGSNYGVTVTSTLFRAQHSEAGTDTSLAYRDGRDLAQSTSFVAITESVGNDNDQTGSGYLQLFNPSSDTFVKHWVSSNNIANKNDYSMNSYSAGYFNTTSSINAIQFKFETGNIDAGDICLYGIA